MPVRRSNRLGAIAGILAVAGLCEGLQARSLKVISPLFSSMRGSLGGAVGSVARGGVAYFRSKVIPTNPSSLLQTASRSAVQSASALWQTTLTEVQQDGWFELAEGAQTGKSLFAKVNQPRIYGQNSTRVTDDAGAAASMDPPYFLDPPADGITVPFQLDTAPVIDDSANTLDIGTVTGGLWNQGSTGPSYGAVFVYLSGPQNSSRSVRQRPYQLVRAYKVTDDANVAFSPINLAALGIPTVAGKVFYVKTYAQDKDGRISLPQEFRVVAVA